MYTNYIQDPDDMYDNPYFMEMFEREIVNKELSSAYLNGDIENEQDRNNVVERVWNKYNQWLHDYFSYEVVHE
jgi:hypothetical protein